MKRYLLALVNAVQELTEILRFGLEDVMERFEDLDTSLYVLATTGDDSIAEELAQEYQWGFDDGYELARSIFEEAEFVDAPVSPAVPTLEVLNEELQNEYWEDEAEDFYLDNDEFSYQSMFST